MANFYIPLVASPPIGDNSGGGGGGGGGGALVVGIYRSQDTGNLTCEKTAAEMWAGVSNGGLILFFDNGDGTGMSYSVVYAEYNNIPTASYRFIVYEPSAYQYIEYTASADDAYPENVQGGDAM